jgi:hypothetical protein
MKNAIAFSSSPKNAIAFSARENMRSRFPLLKKAIAFSSPQKCDRSGFIFLGLTHSA